MIRGKKLKFTICNSINNQNIVAIKAIDSNIIYYFWNGHRTFFQY